MNDLFFGVPMNDGSIGEQNLAVPPVGVGLQNKPYFCPNCRSNRIKFSVITSFNQPFVKDALTGSLAEIAEPVQMAEQEPHIQCRVCGFMGNEMRFVKQAEREPRPGPVTR